jgi:hypothetical protein
MPVTTRTKPTIPSFSPETWAPNPPQAHVAKGLWAIAACFVALELAVSARYGFSRDELYFLTAGKHPALGYVDQPPLAPLMTRLSTLLFGESPSAIRIIPALTGGGVVVGAGLMARVLGGRNFAQMLAGITVACSPILLASTHVAGTTVYDLLAWTFLVLFVLRAVVANQPSQWIWAGVVAGIGLENKDLVFLVLLGLGLGMILTPTRSQLRSRWPWLGLGVALLLWSPNLLWQATHGWPSLAMSHALQIEHSSSSDYTTVLPAEMLYVGFFAVPLVVSGIRYLWRRKELRFVLLAACAVLAYVIVEVPGRPYYVDGLLAGVLAAGAVRIEQRRTPTHKRTNWLIAPIAGAVLMMWAVLPILPVATMARMPFLHKLNYDLGETIGWPQLTRSVAEVYATLSPNQRIRTSIFTENYGEAGAISHYGSSFGLPVALSGHNNFSFWGPGNAPDSTVIAVGSVDSLRPDFGHCAYDRTFHSPHGVTNDENGVQVWTCTDPRGPWSNFWGSLRHFA